MNFILCVFFLQLKRKEKIDIDVKCTGKLKPPQLIVPMEENWPEDSHMITDWFVLLIIILNHSIDLHHKVQVAEDQRCKRIIKLVQKYKKVCDVIGWSSCQFKTMPTWRGYYKVQNVI